LAGRSGCLHCRRGPLAAQEPSGSGSRIRQRIRHALGELKTPEFGRVSRRIRELYDGKPAVRDYIHSICADYTQRAATRQEAKGFLPDRERIFTRSLNYTLEEIPGTVIYHRLFRAPVIYVGAYFDDPQFFNRQGGHGGGDQASARMNLELPDWCRVRLSAPSRQIAA
jgi:hypothetical protein